MNITLPQAVFLFLAAVIVVCSILTVTTKRILRSATYLLFVLFATAGGAALCIFITLTHSFPVSHFVPGEINQKVIGTALMGTEKYQYLLPFEVISVLLLACIIGGILIARKR